MFKLGTVNTWPDRLWTNSDSVANRWGHFRLWAVQSSIKIWWLHKNSINSALKVEIKTVPSVLLLCSCRLHNWTHEQKLYICCDSQLPNHQKAGNTQCSFHVTISIKKLIYLCKFSIIACQHLRLKANIVLQIYGVSHVVFKKNYFLSCFSFLLAW